MTSESEASSFNPRPPADQRGTDAADLILAALDHLRGGLSADGGACGPPTLARQKEDLRQWADRLGLLLSTADLPAKVVRGGQEHELFHDDATDRYFKVILHCMDRIAPRHHWRSRLISLIDRHAIPTAAMGALADWESQPLWQEVSS